jgi:glycosyltransferase involved in cell wall biosynthesis
MSKPETLVVLSPAFPRNESDTAWVPAQQILVRELKNQFPHLEIVVLSFLYPYEKIEYEWNGVKVIALDGMHNRKLKRLWFWFSIWKKLKKLKRENNVIGIFSFWCGECALVGSWFARLNKLTHYCWICGQDARKSNKFVKWIRPGSEELIAISDFLIDEFYRSHGIKPFHFIPIAIDKKMFPEVPAERNIDIIGAGSISFQKNYDQFVLMVEALKKQIANIKAIHCGSGEDEKSIKELTIKFNLENNLSLLGMLPHHEVLQLMQKSKILLHPSSYEGFGMVCLEALYAGAHVISFVKPMKQEIKNWHIVNTKEEMVLKATELLQTPNLSHDRVIVFSVEDSAKKLMQLFDVKNKEAK